MSYATILDVEDMLETDRPDRSKHRTRAPGGEPKAGRERSSHDNPANVEAPSKTVG